MSGGESLQPGRVITGRYEIVRELGAGGMGAVYQARQISMDRMVALKVIHPHIAKRPEVAERFHREMKATSKISHPNTIQVFDYGVTENGQLYLAMEFLSGRSLSSVLEREGALPTARVLHIGKQIVRALGAAHDEKIAHRDLKPDNVMLLERYGERDVVKVLDFGIARFVDGDEAAANMTAEGALLGTPAYMSPEQALGRPVDHRTDFYSLGVLLYELAVGKTPFSAPTLAGYLMAHANELPPEPSTVAPGRVPRSLEDLILRLLSKSADARPGTASEVLRLLEACEVSSPIETVETSPSSPERSSARGGALVVGILFAAVGVLAAVLIGKKPAPAPVADGRPRLEQLLTADGDPLAPKDCRATDPAMVVRLTHAAQALQGSTVGKPRQQDRDALAELAPGTAGANQPAEYWGLVARASLVVEPSPDGALAAAKQALARCPDYALAHNLVGNAEQRAQHFDAARKEYQRALQIEPGYVDPQVNLGVLALRDKDYADAGKAFDSVLAASPRHRRALLARANARIGMKRLAEAVGDLEAATALPPEEAEPWLLLAQLREQLGRADAATEAYCRAKGLGSGEAAARCGR